MYLNCKCEKNIYQENTKKNMFNMFTHEKPIAVSKFHRPHIGLTKLLMFNKINNLNVDHAYDRM